MLPRSKLTPDNNYVKYVPRTQDGFSAKKKLKIKIKFKLVEAFDGIVLVTTTCDNSIDQNK